MSAWEPAALADRRKEVLTRLQERWGKARRPSAEKENSQIDYIESYVGPFLEVVGDDTEPTTGTHRPTEAHIRALMDALKTHGKEESHPFQLESEGEENTQIPAEKRRDLMAEIASAHFRSNMQAWLTISTEHDPSSTSEEELFTIQREAEYRLKLLKTLVSMAEQEVDALELQIRALHAKPLKPEKGA